MRGGRRRDWRRPAMTSHTSKPAGKLPFPGCPLCFRCRFSLCLNKRSCQLHVRFLHVLIDEGSIISKSSGAQLQPNVLLLLCITQTAEGATLQLLER